MSQANDALSIWKERLAYMEREEAKAADPSTKFSIGKEIEEIREKIEEHEAVGPASYLHGGRDRGIGEESPGSRTTRLKLPQVKAQYITLPIAIRLTKEEAWAPVDEKEHLFFVARLHFHLRCRPAGRYRVGEALTCFDFTQGASQGNVSIELQREDISLAPTIRSALLENDLIQEYVQNMAEFSRTAGLTESHGNKRGEFDALSRVRERAQLALKDLRDSFPQACSLDEVFKQSVEIECEVPLPSRITKPIVAVSMFQKTAVDIQLAWMDYLLVRYERRLFGVRKKREAYPRVKYAKRHPNRVRCRAPLATFYYWRCLAQIKTMDEEKHQSEVEDPDEIVIAPPDPVPLRYVPFPEGPTLYQAARAAFPCEWIRRRHSRWTEEELMGIELEDAVDTPWWDRHGPGSAG